MGRRHLLTVFVTPDCPTFDKALEVARRVVPKGIRIKRVVVSSELEASTYGMYGSPTFSLDGEDLFAHGETGGHIGCRLYNIPGKGFAMMPTEEMLRSAIKARISI